MQQLHSIAPCSVIDVLVAHFLLIRCHTVNGTQLENKKILEDCPVSTLIANTSLVSVTDSVINRDIDIFQSVVF